MIIDACRGRRYTPFMAHHSDAMQGMQPTRRAVLSALRGMGHATVGEIAALVGIKDATVRHHLNALMADGLVDAEERRQPVGRPYHVYQLTWKGRALFASPLSRLVEQVLTPLKRRMTPGVSTRLVAVLSDTLAGEVHGQLAGLDFEGRLERLIELLGSRGYEIQWQQPPDRLQLVSVCCPHLPPELRHPEICQIEENLIGRVTGAEVHRDACARSGAPHCALTLVREPPAASTGKTLYD
ncbi:MAG: HTH domain-containing protein [Anaerolineae bacterium]